MAEQPDDRGAPYPTSEAAYAMIADRFKVLGDPTRLRLLHALRDEQRTVNDLAEQLGCSQPNVSKHLSILRKAGMVRRRREGAHVYHGVADVSVFQLCETMCQGIEFDLNRRRDLL